MATSNSDPSFRTSIQRKPVGNTGSVLASDETAILKELKSINLALSTSNAPIWSQDILYFLLQFFGIVAATVFGVFSILAWTAANKSNGISNNALELALQSNQLAILSYCFSAEDDSYRTPKLAVLCTNLTVGAFGQVVPIVASALPSASTGTFFGSSTTSQVVFTSASEPPPGISSSASLTTSVLVSSTPSTTSTSEAANAGSAATTSSAPSPGTSPQTSSSAPGVKSSETGAIVGGAVGGAIAAIGVALLIFGLRRATYKEKLRRSHAQSLEKASEGI